MGYWLAPATAEPAVALPISSAWPSSATTGTSGACWYSTITAIAASGR